MNNNTDIHITAQADNKEPETPGMGRNGLRSQALDLLRFPLAVVVITVHVMERNFLQGIEDTPLLNGMVCLLGGMFVEQSVPVYFFISGFVFFLNITFTKATYIRKMKNRVRSLLIPYFVWNTAVLLKLLIFTLPCLSVFFARQHSISCFDMSPRAVLMSFWDVSKGVIPYVNTGETFPLNAPMWFVRDLIIITVCTPLIYKLLSGGGKKNNILLAALGIVWFMSATCHTGYTNMLTGVLFFSLGANMSICRKDMLQVFGKFFKPALYIYVVLSVGYAATITEHPEVAGIMKRLNLVAGLVVAFNVAAWLISKGRCRVNRFLSSASFFVYASNWVILYEIRTLTMRLTCPETGAGFLLCGILTIAITVSVLLLTFYILQQHAPRMLKVIAGRKQALPQDCIRETYHINK